VGGPSDRPSYRFPHTSIRLGVPVASRITPGMAAASLRRPYFYCSIGFGIVPDNSPTTFTHALASFQDGRILIRSTCVQCGTSRIVPVRDGSIEEWGFRHNCRDVGKVRPRFSDPFDHGLFRDADGRGRIKSACTRCGAFKVVSLADGSLADWESQHDCGNLRQMKPRISH
jgi:hypothetical protein